MYALPRYPHTKQTAPKGRHVNSLFLSKYSTGAKNGVISCVAWVFGTLMKLLFKEVW